MYYVLSDHLSSLTTIVNTTTNEVENFSGELFADRGFTGHEHLTEFNLINMNGRIYDPLLGRFLSPDPYVQLPGYPNSYNRYSYCLNNPLKYTDPSGYRPLPSDENANWGSQDMSNLNSNYRLRPNPNVWNNVGRFHHSPGPVGTTIDKNGNEVPYFQDVITGGFFYEQDEGGYSVPYYEDQYEDGYSTWSERSHFRLNVSSQVSAGVLYILPYTTLEFFDASNEGGQGFSKENYYSGGYKQYFGPKPSKEFYPSIPKKGRPNSTQIKNGLKYNYDSKGQLMFVSQVGANTARLYQDALDDSIKYWDKMGSILSLFNSLSRSPSDMVPDSIKRNNTANKIIDFTNTIIPEIIDGL